MPDTIESIKTMLEYATQAYCDDQPLQRAVKLHTIDDARSGTQCYIRVGKAADGVLCASVVFRGTDSNTDRLNDIKAWRKCVPYDGMNPDIKVHAGFINAYKSDEVRGVILSLIGSEVIERVTVAGHSLGAAMAVLCALDLQYNLPDRNYTVYLYGCPRVGNAQFRRSYNKRVFKTVRVENGNDLITKIPPAMLGYRHVGAKYHIGAPRLPVWCNALHHYQTAYYRSLLRRM